MLLFRTIFWLRHVASAEAEHKQTLYPKGRKLAPRLNLSLVQSNIDQARPHEFSLF
jgi:hypothetical protein